MIFIVSCSAGYVRVPSCGKYWLSTGYLLYPVVQGMSGYHHVGSTG